MRRGVAVGERSDEWSHFMPGPLPDEQRNLSHTKRFGESTGDVPNVAAKHCCCGSAGFLNAPSQQQLPTCVSGFFQLAQPETLSQLSWVLVSVYLVQIILQIWFASEFYI